MQGDDTIRTGIYAKKSRLIRETAQLFPGLNQIYKNYGLLTTDLSK